eukprot:CAMPEP_0115032198 /NCGR_PEP_ID=MMETSP0216-20121206/39013_1 /TAXON_ID=223996 /ORGANISM="Protocruzia adherens, Strain Boccale" /LENGTH=195 /DNA_ID=CAMNT_0002410047 /DNA_START=277 /DNA_END=864 /DNA_ORIENTATION=-
MCCLQLSLIANEKRDDDSDLSGFESFVEAMEESPAAIILALYAFIWIWFVGILCVYHTFLICTGQTTYEHLKGRWENIAGNPYNFGGYSYRNCCNTIFSRIPAPNINPRELIPVNLMFIENNSDACNPVIETQQPTSSSVRHYLRSITRKKSNSSRKFSEDSDGAISTRPGDLEMINLSEKDHDDARDSENRSRI